MTGAAAGYRDERSRMTSIASATASAETRKGAEVLAVDAPTSGGVTDACSLVGQTTCAATGTATLRIHDRFGYGLRRAVAEVIDATPGSAAILFRSEEPGSSVVLGGELCIDRRSAVRVGVPAMVSPAGTAAFPLAVNGPQPGFGGLSAADHLQAVILGTRPALTNALAWLP